MPPGKLNAVHNATRAHFRLNLPPPLASLSTECWCAWVTDGFHAPHPGQRQHSGHRQGEACRRPNASRVRVVSGGHVSRGAVMGRFGLSMDQASTGLCRRIGRASGTVGLCSPDRMRAAILRGTGRAYVQSPRGVLPSVVMPVSRCGSIRGHRARWWPRSCDNPGRTGNLPAPVRCGLVGTGGALWGEG